MKRTTDPVNALAIASTRLHEAEERERVARGEFQDKFMAARAAGHSLRELAKVTGLTFGRLHQIERRLKSSGPREE